jgi:AcrR family transcriptional regulator
VECAKKSFADGGYYTTSISEIAQQAGIARSTFYQYFDNKAHLFQSILDSFLQDLQNAIRPVTIAPGASVPLVQIKANLTRVLDLLLQERELTQILLHDAGPLDRAVENRSSGFYSQVAEMIEHSLTLGISMNLVRPCNARLMSYAIIGALKEVVHQLTSTAGSQPKVEELVRGLLEFATIGILANPPAPSARNSPQAG